MKEEKELPPPRTVARTHVQVLKDKAKFRVPDFTTKNEVLNELGLIFSLVFQHPKVLFGS